MSTIETTGTIYLVGTPIGNLEDMTFRAIRILQEVDMIAAEDTRNTRKLLSHFDIHTPMVSYHEHNKQTKTSELVNEVLHGKSIAIVSDAGLPGIADPGTDLVQAAIEANLNIVPIPGANAALTALIASGLSTIQFGFIGFLPKTSKHRQEMLVQLQNRTDTLLIYESPHRLVATLNDLATILGSTRRLVLARELTKKFETFWRGTIEEALAMYATEKPRGEFVIILEGGVATSNQEYPELSPIEYVHLLLAEGMSKKEAMRKAAVRYNLSRRDIYQLLLENSI